MSFKRTALYTASPTTARGVATRLSSSKEKIVYANGRSIFIRDIHNLGLGDIYSEHAKTTTVARISPTGYYCASADISGTVRVWDLVGEDRILKGEYKVIAGRVNDLDWDGESKRIIAVGEGRQKFGHAFLFDTGNSTGDIIGHSKSINAVSIRQQRPFRAATAADDQLISFYHGAPYKLEKKITTHSNFVQDIRYAPSGDHFASVGSDSLLALYEGKTGDKLAEIAKAHSGSIYGVSWNHDSSFLATASADKTVKIWDASTNKATTTYTLGTSVDDQQVGIVWSAPDTIVSLSLSGNLNVLDPRSGEKPVKVLNAPQKTVTAAVPVSPDTFIVGTADGRVLAYDGAGEASYVAGQSHTNLIAGFVNAKDNRVISIGYDDRVKEISSKEFTPASFSTALQPKSIATTDDDTVFVAEGDVVEAIRSNQKVAELKQKSPATVIAASQNLVAVGQEDTKTVVYKWDGKSFSEAGVLTGNRSALTALAFSPDGTKLAAGDSSGSIVLYDASSLKLITSRWAFHTSRVFSLNWTADSKHCASGSLDTYVYIWSVANPTKNIAIKNAIAGGAHCVFWLEKDVGPGKGTLVATGADASLHIYEITFYP